MYQNRKISELNKLNRNPRIIKDDDFNRLVKSIKDNPEYFNARPVILSNRTGELVIIAGNQRYEAAKKIGLKEIPTYLIEGLTEEKEREIIIRDNVSNGQWDFDILANEWEAADLNEWGVVVPDLEDIKTLEAEEDDYDVPEGGIETDIVFGDLFEIGEHRLLCGDSTDSDSVAKLMNGDKADMVFTDPPYGVNYDGGHSVKGVRREKLKNDGTADIYNEVLPICYLFSINDAPLYLWYSDSKSIAVLNAVLNAGYELRNNIIWNKNVAQFGAIGAQYKTKHEPCIYAYKKGHKVNWCGANNEVSVWDISRSSKNEFHPTQKPIELCAKAIGNHKVDSVLDLFGGSGSTMVASHQLKKKSYLSELDPKYCQVIVDRMKKLDPTIKIKKNGELLTN